MRPGKKCEDIADRLEIRWFSSWLGCYGGRTPGFTPGETAGCIPRIQVRVAGRGGSNP